MNDIYTGNAQDDGQLTKHWIIGHFLPEDDIHHSDDVEIKWGVHQQDDKRQKWVTGENRTAVSILVSGKVIFEFRDKKCELSRQGDYVMWGGGVEHRWEVAEDSVIITVRWPSVSTN
jgi:cupin superfamily acireductone dioxygenase involved in methionine salvage